jgi:hypothetical protein
MPNRLIAILLAAGMILASVPVAGWSSVSCPPDPFSSVSCSPDVCRAGSQALDLCSGVGNTAGRCDGEVECSGEDGQCQSDGTGQPLDRDCCPDGCDECPLPCCHGMHFSEGALVSSFFSFDSSLLSLFHDESDLSSVDPDGVYHPPRS